MPAAQGRRGVAQRGVAQRSAAEGPNPSPALARTRLGAQQNKRQHNIEYRAELGGTGRTAEKSPSRITDETGTVTHRKGGPNAD